MRNFWHASRAGWKSGVPSSRPCPAKWLAAMFQNAVGDGVGEVFLDVGVFGDVAAEVGSSEVEWVGGVGPKIWKCGFPPGECHPRDGSRDGADKGEVVGACLVVVEALGPNRAEELAGAGFCVMREVGPSFDRF